MANYVVINNRGLVVRSKPDTQTGQPVRVMSQGEGFEAQDKTEIGDQTWVRLSTDNDVTQRYVCVKIGNHILAQETNEGGEMTFPRIEWVQALDNWARIQGFKGPKP
jgi:hypothetical protein